MPVDVFNRASVNDNVFIALFTTDPDLQFFVVGTEEVKLFEKTTGGFVLYDKTEADKSPTPRRVRPCRPSGPTAVSVMTR